MVKGIQSKHIVGIAHERHKLITYFKHMGVHTLTPSRKKRFCFKHKVDNTAA